MDGIGNFVLETTILDDDDDCWLEVRETTNEPDFCSQGFTYDDPEAASSQGFILSDDDYVNNTQEFNFIIESSADAIPATQAYGEEKPAVVIPDLMNIVANMNIDEMYKELGIADEQLAATESMEIDQADVEADVLGENLSSYLSSSVAVEDLLRPIEVQYSNHGKTKHVRSATRPSTSSINHQNFAGKLTIAPLPLIFLSRIIVYIVTCVNSLSSYECRYYYASIFQRVICHI